MKLNKIIIVDLETTNFLRRGGLIVEVGIAELDLCTGNIKILYNQLVKEKEFNINHKDSWIFKNSNLKFDEVMNAKDLDTDELQDIFNEYPATAYNKKFDFDFLRSRGLKIKELPCPMIIATNICKIQSRGGHGYKWPKLEEAWKSIMKTEYVELHRGIDDAVHEAKLIYKLYKEGKFKIELDSKEQNKVQNNKSKNNRIELLI